MTTVATIKESGRGASQGDAVSSYGAAAPLPDIRRRGRHAPELGRPLQMIVSFVFCSQCGCLMLLFNWLLQCKSHY